MKLSVFGDTIVGKQRDHNEDSFIILNDLNKQWQEVNDQTISISGSRGLIVAVADGMGGTNAGEVASSIALSTVKERIKEIPFNIKNPDQVQRIFSSIIQSINTNIIREAKKNKETTGMGTTIILGWIFKNTLFITWIGDSRCYHYNNKTYDQLVPLSDDHSLVWSRVKSGEITPEEARLSSESNLLLQSLGDTFQDPIPDFKWIKLGKKDRILLCSDGLNSMLSAVGIQQILDFSDSTKETCLSLINAANNAGGHDNITAVLIDVIETDTDSKTSFRSNIFDKKWFRVLITLILLVLFVTGAFLANKRFNIISSLNNTFRSIVNKDSKKSAADIATDLTTTQTDTTGVHDHDLTDTNVIHGPKEETENRILATEKYVSMLDTAQSKKALKIALDRIEMIELKIEPVQPGKSEYQPEFYNRHSKRLESILHSLDSLKNQIKKYAEIKDYEIVSIRVKNIEENKVVSLIRTIDNLNTRTENILSAPQIP